MREENTKNNAAALKRNSKMTNWGVQVDQIEKYFNTVAAQAKHDNYFENLYVSRANSERQIQLYAGVHPIGSSETTRDLLGNVAGQRIHAEKGATLVISQSVTGDVAVMLYPYKSEKFQQTDNNIIWRVFSDPKKITDRVLKAAVKDFFTYVRVSSALFSESATDRMRIRYLSFRGKRYKEGSSIAKLVFSHWLWAPLGIIGSLASITTSEPVASGPISAPMQNIPNNSGQQVRNCPPMPPTVSIISYDVKSDINASIGSFGKLKAGEVGAKIEVVAKNLFEKFPNVDRMLTIQIMSATYCQLLADSKSITDSERLNRWETFQEKLLNTKPASHDHLPRPRLNPSSDASAAAALNRMQEVQKFENAKPRLARPFDQTMFHDYPRDITLTWDEVPNADHYEVEIQWQHLLTKDWHMMPRYPVSTKDRTHSFQFIGAGEGRWRIIAINPDGIRSSYSEWRQFLCEK